MVAVAVAVVVAASISQKLTNKSSRLFGLWYFMYRLFNINIVLYNIVYGYRNTGWTISQMAKTCLFIVANVKATYNPSLYSVFIYVYHRFCKKYFELHRLSQFVLPLRSLYKISRLDNPGLDHHIGVVIYSLVTGCRCCDIDPIGE